VEGGFGRLEEPRDFFIVELLRHRDRRQACAMEYFVGIGVAYSAQEPGIGERSLERVIFAAQRACERGYIALERFDASRVEFSERRLAFDHVKRGAALSARFGQEQRAVVEAEGGQGVAPLRLRPALLPMKTPRDHQVQHEPQSSLD